jgi:hypothetical protein
VLDERIEFPWVVAHQAHRRHAMATSLGRERRYYDKTYRNSAIVKLMCNRSSIKWALSSPTPVDDTRFRLMSGRFSSRSATRCPSSVRHHMRPRGVGHSETSSHRLIIVQPWDFFAVAALPPSTVAQERVTQLATAECEAVLTT